MGGEDNEKGQYAYSNCSFPEAHMPLVREPTWYQGRWLSVHLLLLCGAMCTEDPIKYREIWMRRVLENRFTVEGSWSINFFSGPNLSSHGSFFLAASTWEVGLGTRKSFIYEGDRGPILGSSR